MKPSADMARPTSPPRRWPSSDASAFQPQLVDTAAAARSPSGSSRRRVPHSRPPPHSSQPNMSGSSPTYIRAATPHRRARTRRSGASRRRGCRSCSESLTTLRRSCRGRAALTKNWCSPCCRSSSGLAAALPAWSQPVERASDHVVGAATSIDRRPRGRRPSPSRPCCPCLVLVLVIVLVLVHVVVAVVAVVRRRRCHGPRRRPRTSGVGRCVGRRVGGAAGAGPRVAPTNVLVALVLTPN